MYIIIRGDNPDLAALWDGRTIVFQSRDEAKDFAYLFPGFFGEVECGTVKIDLDTWSDTSYILYQDLIKLDSYKEAIEKLKSFAN